METAADASSPPPRYPILSPSIQNLHEFHQWSLCRPFILPPRRPLLSPPASINWTAAPTSSPSPNSPSLSLSLLALAIGRTHAVERRRRSFVVRAAPRQSPARRRGPLSRFPCSVDPLAELPPFSCTQARTQGRRKRFLHFGPYVEINLISRVSVEKRDSHVYV
jgi:hypothetical protein